MGYQISILVNSKITHSQKLLFWHPMLRFFQFEDYSVFLLIIQSLYKFQPSKQTIAVSVISLVKWCAVPTFGIFHLYSYNVPHVPQNALFVRLTAYTSFMQSVETSCVCNIMFPVQVIVVFWVQDLCCLAALQKILNILSFYTQRSFLAIKELTNQQLMPFCLSG